MNTCENRINDVLVCGLEGEININNSPQLRKVFDSVIKRGEKKVLIDFSNVSYIDSSGLATLIEMYQRLKNIGGQLRFSGLNQKIMNVFEITKLNKIFDVFSDRETGLKDF